MLSSQKEKLLDCSEFSMQKPLKRFIGIMILAGFATLISLPQSVPISFTLPEFIPISQKSVSFVIGSPNISFTLFGKQIQHSFEFKRGLDIQGGMQVVLEADMSAIAEIDREQALQSAREVLLRRVDLYGINEPSVQTAKSGESYRIIVELPGVTDTTEALRLVGQTAQLEFQLLKQQPIVLDESGEISTASAQTTGLEIIPIGLTGKQLKRSTVQFDPQTGEPQVSIEFDSEGAKIFAQVTQENTGEILGIFLDQGILMAPKIQVPILTGQAVITGDFSLDDAKNLSIQLNAGALPVPITVIEQRTIGASLGQESVSRSIQAGLIGIGFVMLFMSLYYGVRGVLASFSLVLYAVFTMALYKILGVTLTLPGIAGLLLSIGMAVDANILIFERMKEELRIGKPFEQAMELGFGRAWDSIKDANLATILTALVLINPLELPFLNTSGLVRGFGITLLIGVVLGLITGVVITRTTMRLFLKDSRS
jgi:preprotein translocase subunit SecD